ncbi:GNAT family N-acetyltransferase [Sciscionella sediminilitoris]|uniref:GNAT family N-acetyltransferase n=1 Tax=Sciscionella sediminilitoris TaxID=1445613 RepID=UPI0004DF64DC|nr:GNAT family N-acetyltransferase [Sciscionella sp. SE31]
MDIRAVGQESREAVAMMDALWEEIQLRYGFRAPNPMPATRFDGFWLAFGQQGPVGSIAMAPLTDAAAELDVMYVVPGQRGTGLAAELLAVAEGFAIRRGIGTLRLRTGEPQPESMRFYVKSGFRPIPRYGKWAGDESARCFEKEL